MTPPLELQAETPAGARLVRCAESLAKQLSLPVTQHERDGIYSQDNARLLKEAGYFVAPIPAQFGGLDVTSVHDILVASTRLARGDPSTTLGVNMHLLIVLNIVRRWRLACLHADERRAEAFGRSLELELAHGANLPIPYPWPWRTDWSALSGWTLWGSAALALAFLAPWIVLPSGLAELVRARHEPSRRSVAIAAGVIGAIGLHHVAVRADAPHLAQCSWPILLLALERSRAWLGAAAGRIAWGAIALGSLLAALVFHPQLSRSRPGVERNLVAHAVAGDEILLPAGQEHDLATLERLFSKHAPPDARVWIVNQPTLYPVLGRVAPLWWLHPYFRATEAEQRELLDEIESRGVDWVIVVGEGGETEEERAFPQTHPLVWEYLLATFSVLSSDQLPAGLHVFRRGA